MPTARRLLHIAESCLPACTPGLPAGQGPDDCVRGAGHDGGFPADSSFPRFLVEEQYVNRCEIHLQKGKTGLSAGGFSVLQGLYRPNMDLSCLHGFFCAVAAADTQGKVIADAQRQCAQLSSAAHDPDLPSIKQTALPVLC